VNNAVGSTKILLRCISGRSYLIRRGLDVLYGDMFQHINVIFEKQEIIAARSGLDMARLMAAPLSPDKICCDVFHAEWSFP
jgi:hypothetical protein